jgi:hypothetical protein
MLSLSSAHAFSLPASLAVLRLAPHMDYFVIDDPPAAGSIPFLIDCPRSVAIACLVVADYVLSVEASGADDAGPAGSSVFAPGQMRC